MDEVDFLDRDLSHDGSDDVDEDETSSMDEDDKQKLLPNFIELQPDEEESEIIKQMSKSRGGKVKRYKKEKSLGVLC